jgi:hypothetical protein
MAAMGITDEEEYNTFDPEGSFFSACTGYDMGDAKPEGDETTYMQYAEALIGTPVGVTCVRGGERDDGDFYRNISFSAVEQEAAE